MIMAGPGENAVAEGRQPEGGAPKGYVTAAANLESDGAAVVDLWQRGFARFHQPKAKLEWFYGRNPQGDPVVMLLRQADGTEPVGVASAVPRRMRLGERTVSAAQMVDFVVLAEHRSFFPALALQREVRRHALGRYELLYGTPNKESLAVFRKAGYAQAFEMVRRARVLRSTPYLSRMLPAGLARLFGPVVDRGLRLAAVLRFGSSRRFASGWCDRPDARFDGLWARCAAKRVLMGVRDREYLAWRFADCPRRRFRFFVVTQAGDGRLLAYAACEAEERALHVRDFLVDPELPDAWRGFWGALVADASRQGFATLSVDFGGSDEVQRRLESAGFVVRERRPVYATAPGWPSGELEGLAWHLTDADEDD